MSDADLFPPYIPRPEERKIILEAAKVRTDGKSRAVLLYGPGGTGKTRLVRQLSRTAGGDHGSVWLEPIDVDDPQHWLLSNLERQVARQLDPEEQYFGQYLKHLSELPRYAGPRTSHETVLSHIGRIRAHFVNGYKNYIERTGNSVVITFDTVEAIRGMYLLLNLTQWMKALPGTLFILAGRPLPGGEDWRDSIKSELEDPHIGIPVNIVRLSEFSAEAAREYLDQSGIAASLSPDEKGKLICLTQGHPLWLAFTIDYLATIGLPVEAQARLQDIQQDLPYRGDPTPAGQARAEDFKRRLVAPYQDSDFWHEAIKRLAVVRESVSEPVWRRLMADRPQPGNTSDPEQAWETLRQTEWIRPRANSRYVTLHDAVAEELARRVIPLHDQDEQWRQQQWRRAADIYAELAGELESQIAERQASVAGRLHVFEDKRLGRGPRQVPAEEEAGLIRDVTELDGHKQELHQLQSAQLFYQLLSSFPEGAQQFLALLGQARTDHDVLFEDLLASEMQRFLPGGPDISTLGGAVSAAIGRARDWLEEEGTSTYVDIGLSMADFLIEREQLDAALDLLDRLPVPPSDHLRRYRLSNLRGNACMRTSGRVREGDAHFRTALAEVRELKSPDQLKLIAQAYKELGFYCRNLGLWEQADEAYQAARDEISKTLSAQSTEADREELASIQTNWAYLKGIGGSYRDGINLVESAINVRRRLGRHHEVAISLSVNGEVYRYQRLFSKAWNAYAEAEQIFQEQSSWSWLGLIYQEQAICLFQSIQDGVLLLPDQDPAKLAQSLILQALDLCHDLNARSYPSALNRAGRIFGENNFDMGLGYLRKAADSAREMSDGWFWFASLIEYAELNYRAWSETGDSQYVDQISTVAEELQNLTAEFEFPELRGRWIVLQGHLGLHEVLRTGSEEELDAAFENYRTGFPLITHGYVGSYGASAIPEEFRKFSDLLWKLPPEVRARWQQGLRHSWSGEGESATLLLARLEELY